jgi:hypothetical protein
MVTGGAKRDPGMPRNARSEVLVVSVHKKMAAR